MWRCGRAGPPGGSRWRPSARRRSVEHKGEIDLVTAIDRASEKAILAIIGRAFPGHGVLAEESDPRTGDAEHLWVVDPLDGTTNYSRGFPYFCVSVALARAGRVVVAAVYQPLLDETVHRDPRAGGLPQRQAPAGLGAGAARPGVPGDRIPLRHPPQPTHQHRPLHRLRHPLPGDPQGRRRGPRPGVRRRRTLRRLLGTQAAPLGHRGRLAADRGGRRPGHRARGTPLAASVRDIVASNGLVHGEMLAVLRPGRPTA